MSTIIFIVTTSYMCIVFLEILVQQLCSTEPIIVHIRVAYQHLPLFTYILGTSKPYSYIKLILHPDPIFPKHFDLY